MQQVFFKRKKYKFILLEVFIALLLFSILIAPFLSSPVKSLKKNRDHLIQNELHRYKHIYIAQILKKLETIKKLNENTSIKLDPVHIDLNPLGTFCYNTRHTLKLKEGKKSNSTLVTINLFFEASTPYLPKVKPYKYQFILKNKKDN